MFELKKIRKMAGLNQKQFAEKYHIPLQTLKQWEASPESKAFRKPPEYVVYLLEQSVYKEIADGMLSMVMKSSREKKQSKTNDSITEAAKLVWG